MEKLVIIPCGGAKLTEPAPAADIYIGSMFADTLRTARTMTSDENIRILSAKHGLRKLDEIVEPYDVKMGSGDDVTIGLVADQLSNNKVPFDFPGSTAADTVSSFMDTYFGFKWSFHFWTILILAGYIIGFRAMGALFMRYVSFLKR
jgi:hypothetical protein